MVGSELGGLVVIPPGLLLPVSTGLERSGTSNPDLREAHPWRASPPSSPRWDADKERHPTRWSLSYRFHFPLAAAIDSCHFTTIFTCQIAGFYLAGELGSYQRYYF